jgi:hypothetical protein
MFTKGGCVAKKDCKSEVWSEVGNVKLATGDSVKV